MTVSLEQKIGEILNVTPPYTKERVLSTAIEAANALQALFKLLDDEDRLDYYCQVTSKVIRLKQERDALLKVREAADALAGVITKTCSLCGETSCEYCRVDLLLEDLTAYKEARDALCRR